MSVEEMKGNSKAAGVWIGQAKGWAFSPRHRIGFYPIGFGRFYKRIEGSRTLSPFDIPHEQPIFPANGEWSDCSFRPIVINFQTPIIKIERQLCPMIQRIGNA
jgi:hypothetical protein